MVIVAFLLGVVITGAVLSAVPSNDESSRHELDYHYVPYAGDCFGA